MFKKLFGTKAESGGKSGDKKANTADKTINSLEGLTKNEEQLEKRKTLLEKRFDEETQKAQAFIKANKKQQAMMCLKKKKMIGEQVVNVENLILRVTEQKMMLESQATIFGTMAVMKGAADVQVEVLEVMNINKVDVVLQTIQEHTDEYREITEVLSNPTGLAGDLDEDELLRELEELEQQQLDEELLEPAPVPTTAQPAHAMPSVPTAAPSAPEKAQKTPEELEMEQLEAEMAA